MPFNPITAIQPGEGTGGQGMVGLPRLVPGAWRMGAPRNLKARITDIGSFILSWRDVDREEEVAAFRNWEVTYTSAALAGSPSSVGGGHLWAKAVREAGTRLDMIAVIGDGREIKREYVSTGLPDGYVQVTGISSTGYPGAPSAPIFLPLESGGDIAAANVTGLGVIGGVYQDLYGLEYLDLKPFFKPPGIVTNFGGVQIYMEGYLSSTGGQWDEIGSMWRADGSNAWQPDAVNGASDAWRLRIPEPEITHTGNGAFTTATNFQRSSGTAFDASIVGRLIRVPDDSTDSNIGLFKVGAFVNASNITTTTSYTGTIPFPGAWKVYEQMTMKWVSINKNGNRTDDPTTAPGVNF